jgi:death-on-curing protein
VRFLTLRQLVRTAERTLDVVDVRDIGLLESAVARPRTTVFGADAYPTLDLKAAALVHSIAKNHALIDGNERLALVALLAFYGLNGRRLTVTNDEAYDFIVAIVTDELDGVEAIADVLATATEAHDWSG